MRRLIEVFEREREGRGGGGAYLDLGEGDVSLLDTVQVGEHSHGLVGGHRLGRGLVQQGSPG
jgi:hypothetical protein